MGMSPDTGDLQKFMAAIRATESSGNYQAIGANRGSKYGVAEGGYQIMSAIWPGWAAAAGFAGLSRSDYLSNKNNVQDRIAAYQMSKYYDRYDGDWGLVAAAWFSGMGNADKAKAAGVNSLSGVNDSGNSPGSGINVPTYVQRVLSSMGKTGNSADRAMIATAQRVGAEAPPVEAPEVAKTPARQLAQEVILNMSEMLKSGQTTAEDAKSAMGMFGPRKRPSPASTTPPGVR